MKAPNQISVEGGVSPSLSANPDFLHHQRDFDFGTIRSSLTGETARLQGRLFRPTIMLPEKFLPRPQDVEASQQQGLRWAAQFDLVRGRAAIEKLNLSRFGYNFQYALLNNLESATRDLVTDVITWYFFVDDVVDEGYAASGMTTKEVQAALRVLCDILERRTTQMIQVPRLRYGNAEYGEIYRGLCAATLDIMERLSQYPAEIEWFASELSTWIKSIELEYLTHVASRDLSELSYMNLRRVTVGMDPMYEIGAIVNGLQKEFTRFRDPLNQIRYLAVVLVAVLNDIVSLAKELGTQRDSEVLNIITIHHRALLRVGHERKPLQAAVDRAVDLFNAELSGMLQAVEDTISKLKATGMDKAGVEEIKKVLAMFFNGVISNVDWHLSASRYRGSRVTPDIPLEEAHSRRARPHLRS